MERLSLINTTEFAYVLQDSTESQKIHETSNISW